MIKAFTISGNTGGWMKYIIKFLEILIHMNNILNAWPFHTNLWYHDTEYNQYFNFQSQQQKQCYKIWGCHGEPYAMQSAGMLQFIALEEASGLLEWHNTFIFSHALVSHSKGVLRRVEVKLHVHLTSALDENDKSLSYMDIYTLGM
jgi:hypothetical protein